MATATVRRSPLTALQRCIRPPVDSAPRPRYADRPRVNVSAKVVRFVEAFVKQGCVDARSAAQAAGYTRPDVGRRLAVKYAHVIEETKIKFGTAYQMELDEGLRLTASLARTANDERVRLGAVQTVLRVHGALSEKVMPPAERRSIAGMIEELVLSIADKSASAAHRQQARAIVEREAKDGSKVRVGVEVTSARDAVPELPPPADGLDPDPTDL